MKRNVNATCGNCPFGEVVTEDAVLCRLLPDYCWRAIRHICGQHPEFWIPAEPAKPAESIPTCCPEPTNGRLRNPEEVYKLFWSNLGTPDAKLNVQCKTEDSKNDK